MVCQYFKNDLYKLLNLPSRSNSSVAPDGSPPVISVYSGVVTVSRSSLGEFPALSVARASPDMLSGLLG